VAEGVDVTALTQLFLAFSRGSPRFGLPDRTMGTLLGVMFPLGGIVSEEDLVRESRGL
jgi:hypothetical protein